MGEPEDQFIPVHDSRSGSTRCWGSAMVLCPAWGSSAGGPRRSRGRLIIYLTEWIINNSSNIAAQIDSISVPRTLARPLCKSVVRSIKIWRGLAQDQLQNQHTIIHHGHCSVSIRASPTDRFLKNLSIMRKTMLDSGDSGTFRSAGYACFET